MVRVLICRGSARLCVLQTQVWSLEQPEWHCRIDEGSAGLVASCWSPDGRHILNTTEFHVSAQAPVPDGCCETAAARPRKTCGLSRQC